MSQPALSAFKAKPYLKWAGGKSQLLRAISQRFPYSPDDSFTYIEPFIGSGAVFFWVKRHFPRLRRTVINDRNADLILTYRVIQNQVDTLIECLRDWEAEYLQAETEERKRLYYDRRARYNLRQDSQVERAALFVFLNRTCFNGLYRVNRHDAFNVPMGRYAKPRICDAENLREVSAALADTEILHDDFSVTLAYAEKPSFFYFDPPYRPLSATSSFNAYAQAAFDDAEQQRLKVFCDELSAAGHPWLLSNSAPPDGFFEDLYQGYHIERVSARRAINAKAERRGALDELLISLKG